MINWTEATLDRLLTEESDGPFVMLNLLQFQPDSGRDRYLAYWDAFAPLQDRYALGID